MIKDILKIENNNIYEFSKNDVSNNNNSIFKRLNSCIKPEVIEDKVIYVFGCGSTGSNIVNILVKLGFRKFVLFDYDEVEAHNIVSANYGSLTPDTVGVDTYSTKIFYNVNEEPPLFSDFKVDVLYNMIIGFDSSILVQSYKMKILKDNIKIPEKLRLDPRIIINKNELDTIEEPDFAFLCFDNVEARFNLVNLFIKNNFNNCYIVDTGVKNTLMSNSMVFRINEVGLYCFLKSYLRKSLENNKNKDLIYYKNILYNILDSHIMDVVKESVVAQTCGDQMSILAALGCSTIAVSSIIHILKGYPEEMILNKMWIFDASFSPNIIEVDLS